jgi:hypothetical protein
MPLTFGLGRGLGVAVVMEDARPDRVKETFHLAAVGEEFFEFGYQGLGNVHAAAFFPLRKGEDVGWMLITPGAGWATGTGAGLVD